VAQRIDPAARLLRTWRLEGGISARVTALEVELAGGEVRRVVVRQYGEANLRRNPRIAADELRLLQMLRSAGLPVPAPYLGDESCEILSTPYLVIELVDGGTADGPSDAGDLARQLATALVAIHRAGCARQDLPRLPEQDEVFAERLRSRPARLDESLSEGLVRDALDRAWPPERRNRSVLLHGDYWPGNTLWRDGTLVAVIDWEDAAFGDPLADLANGRLEIRMLSGPDAMNEFTRCYRSLVPSVDCSSLPCWDLCAALRPAGRMSEWGIDGNTLRRLQAGHRSFVEEALEQLPA
jgi:aminoglycoside phosphotransferase (APT) family kinase protein